LGEESIMDEDGIEQQIDEILEALQGTSGKEIGRDVLEKELRKFLEYGVPFEHAKQTLVKKFGAEQ
jgi:SOS-response transcriptional repressor LexA